MITIRASFENGNQVITRFSGNQEDAEAFYLGHAFKLVSDSRKPVKCVRIEVIDKE